MLDRSRSWSVFFLLLTIVCGSLSGRLYASKRSDQDKGLKHFYIVNQAVSDQPALQFSHILDVRIEEATTAVRAFRVAPHNEFCAKPVTIKAAERQLPSNTVAKLVAQAKLCSMTDEEWARVRSIVANARGPAVQDSARAAIVAECPSGTRTIILPTVEDTLLNQPLQSDSMRDFDILIAVQNLSYEIIRRAWGDKSFFSRVSEEEDKKLQDFAKSLIPELTSGLFDRGFESLCPAMSGESVATQKNDCTYYQMGQRLAGYRGVMAPQTPRVQLLHLENLHFSRYEPPVYPPSPRAARIIGDVRLELTADSQSGKVRKVRVVSGHPFLINSAKSSALNWQFDPAKQDLDTVIHVDLAYIDCQN